MSTYLMPVVGAMTGSGAFAARCAVRDTLPGAQALHDRWGSCCRGGSRHAALPMGKDARGEHLSLVSQICA